MIRKSIWVPTALVGVLLVVPFQPSAADAAGREASVTVVRESLAAEYVAVLSPPDAMRENIRRGAASSIDKGLGQDPTLPQAEVNYPGLTKAMKEAGLAAVQPVIDNAYSDLAGRQRALLARSFTTPELRELLAFYRSPAATQGTAEALDASRNALAPAAKKELQEKALAGRLAGKDIGNATRPGASAKLSKSTEQAYLKFSAAPVAHKLAVFTPTFEQLLAQWANDTAPKIQSAIQDAMTDAAKSFIEGKQRVSPTPAN